MRRTFLPSSSVALKLAMYPSSFKMRAISSFSLEAGTSSFWCRAEIELRMRASKSATGSVKLIFVHLLLSSPVCPPSAGETCRDVLQKQPLAFSYQPLACSSPAQDSFNLVNLANG